MKTVLIVGATGMVGSHLLQLLLDHPEYERVIACTRRALDAPPDPKLISVVKPLAEFSVADVGSVDDYFCALGTTIKKAGSQASFQHVDRDLPVQTAKIALIAKARRCLIVSSVGADPKSSNFYLRTKGEVEAALAGLQFEALHVFRPSILTGKREDSRPAERLGIAAASALQWAMIGGLRKYRPIPATTVARAMIAAAALPTTGQSTYEYNAILDLAAHR